jgi:hypothetical protein
MPKRMLIDGLCARPHDDGAPSDHQCARPLHAAIAAHRGGGTATVMTSAPTSCTWRSTSSTLHRPHQNQGEVAAIAPFCDEVERRETRRLELRMRHASFETRKPRGLRSTFQSESPQGQGHRPRDLIDKKQERLVTALARATSCRRPGNGLAWPATRSSVSPSTGCSASFGPHGPTIATIVSCLASSSPTC